jgi:hypothetical protein
MLARLAVSLAFVLVTAGSALTVQHHHYTITVVDKLTGVPIPNIRLSTTNGIHFTSNAAGKIDFYEPGLMGQTVFFGLPSCSASKCTHDGSTCTTNADCNQGHEPVGLPFFGSCFVGTQLVPAEQGTVQMRLCPAGTSPVCPNPPGPGQCVSDTSTGGSLANPVPLPSQRFRLKVVDAQTGRGVPLVEVATPNATYQTDSGGLVAFHDPALMGTTVQFNLSGHGYAATAASLLATAGGSGQVPITRVNLAQRIYRVTGGGIYRDTVLMEETPPLASPVLNAQVFGQDSVLTAVYGNRVFWIWGDTSRPGHPLGNFRAPGAQSFLPGAGGLDPDVGVNLNYFGDGAGFVKGMCPAANFPNPPGVSGSLLCWMSGLGVVRDAGGVQRLYARYSLVNGASQSVETGLGRFNDTTQQFDKMLVYANPVPNPGGHPEPLQHAGVEYLYFISKSNTGFWDFFHVDNLVRVLATESSILNPATYEAFTALVQGSSTQLDTNPDGTLHYTWKTGTAPLSGHVEPGKSQIPSDQKLFGHVVDPDSGTAGTWAALNHHGISIGWNSYRKRWVQTTQEVVGSSFLGEVWFQEADTPMGPWVFTRKIVTHNNYSFYNTRHHPFFNKQHGKEIFFEDTYTTYLTNAVPTPRYNYNQIMYKLDLDTPGVILPVPVYDLSAATTPGNFVTKKGLRISTPDSTPPFLAPDRAGMANTVPVWWNDAACKQRALVVGGTPTTTPIFWALPGNAANPPPTTIPLYDYVNAGTGAHAYSIDGNLSLSGFTRVQDPIARVWANPIRVTLPVHDYLGSLIADAGADRCVVESSATHLATVQLDGSGTYGIPNSYTWTWPGGSASGIQPTVNLPVGLHNITLTVVGNDGQISTDNVVVRVDVCTSCC